MFPMLLAEQLAAPFNFYFGGKMQRGIRHSSELYGLTYEFGLHDRAIAYQTACELMSQTTAVIITASTTRYALWVSLRSPIYSKLAPSGNQTASRALPVAHRQNWHLALAG